MNSFVVDKMKFCWF